MRTIAVPHALDDGWRDAFGVRHCFIGRHVVSQIVCVDTAERPQKRAQTGARAFTTGALDCAYAIASSITRPFLHTVAHARVPGMHIWIVRCRITLQDRTCWRHISFHNRTRGWFVGVLQYPIAHLVRRATDQTQDWWPIVLIRALAFAFIGAPARRVGHVAMGRPFSPPRSDTAQQPRTPFQSSVRPGG